MMMGHKDLKTTKRYIRAVQLQRRAARAFCPQIGHTFLAAVTGFVGHERSLGLRPRSSYHSDQLFGSTHNRRVNPTILPQELRPLQRVWTTLTIVMGRINELHAQPG